LVCLDLAMLVECDVLLCLRCCWCLVSRFYKGLLGLIYAFVLAGEGPSCVGGKCFGHLSFTVAGVSSKDIVVWSPVRWEGLVWSLS
jgi:hypothetical protein